MKQINDGSSKTRPLLLTNTFGTLLSTACGTPSIIRSRNMPFGIDDDDAAFNKTHQITNCIALPCQQPRPIAVASSLLARKWKTSLKKVKLRLKTKTKPKTIEEPTELCKKRILMGEKCRALNLSGVLHYDKQGILLPED